MKRLALFIGINSYSRSPLHCACADAEALHREFSSCYDEARLLTDREATDDNITREILSLRRMARPGDMFVFFFSGHGFDHEGERLLDIPERDARGRPRDTVLYSTATLRKRTDLKGLHRLFILDCCRARFDSGSEFPDIARDPSQSPPFVLRHGRDALVRPTLLSSSAPGQSAYENTSLGHGYFTEALLQTIRDTSVRNFNQFRDRLDAIMAEQIKPGKQDPYFEGPIGSNLPFWPAWEEAAAVEAPPPRRRRPRPAVPTVSEISEPPLIMSSFVCEEVFSPADRPNIIRAPQRGMWRPAPGYVWIRTHNDTARSAKQITDVEWKPNHRCPEMEHMVTSQKEGKWIVDPGWSMEDDFTDWFSAPPSSLKLRWRWNPGVSFGRKVPNVIASHTPDRWVPAPGYVWTRTNSDASRPTEQVTTVRWKPNLPLRGFEHVVAGAHPGQWKPQPGWAFLNDEPYDFSVCEAP